VVSSSCKNDANDVDVIEILSCYNSLEIENQELEANVESNQVGKARTNIEHPKWRQSDLANPGAQTGYQFIAQGSKSEAVGGMTNQSSDVPEPVSFSPTGETLFHVGPIPGTDRSLKSDARSHN
jgi:hypothetical protein